MRHQIWQNKESIPLSQSLEVVVYSITTHAPVYYRTFREIFQTPRSLETILHDLDTVGLTDVVLVTDRSYETIKNLEMYVSRNQKMIMAAKVGQKSIMDKIDSFAKFDHHPEEMKYDIESDLNYKQFDMEYQIKSERGKI